MEKIVSLKYVAGNVARIHRKYLALPVSNYKLNKQIELKDCTESNQKMIING